MQFTSILLGALALPLFATAQPVNDSTSDRVKTAKVVNKCSFPVYVQSTPNGGAPGRIVRLQGDGHQHFREVQLSEGATIGIARTREFSTQLSFGYHPDGGVLYYDLGSQFGNPFIGYENNLVANDKTCDKFRCAPHDEECYSNPAEGHQKLGTCEYNDLTLTLCA